MAVAKVGVVGCGVMGSGIAEVSARAGFATVVREVNDALLQQRVANIHSSMQRAMDKGKMKPEEMQAALGRLKATTKLADFRDCDLVIEAVIEDLNLKKEIFAELDRSCLPKTILASNTSCLPITELAQTTQRPDKVLGLHFFNPAPVMKLVELVKTPTTSKQTIHDIEDFVKAIEKTAIYVNDSPGFVVNRLVIAFLLEAIRALEAGIASKEDIDKGIVLGLNHPMGPLALLDFIGNDTTLYIARAMHERLKDPKFAPPKLLEQMVAEGRLGRKSGKGFYDYPQK